MSIKVKCDCCGINTATFKDYREYPSGSHTIQPWVCVHCLNLNDYWFFELMSASDENRQVLIEELLCEIDIPDWTVRDSWL